MSRQSKAAKKRTLAKAITAMHLKGERGPKSSTPKHGKDLANRTYTKTKRTAEKRQKPQ